MPNTTTTHQHPETLHEAWLAETPGGIGDSAMHAGLSGYRSMDRGKSYVTTTTALAAIHCVGTGIDALCDRMSTELEDAYKRHAEGSLADVDDIVFACGTLLNVREMVGFMTNAAADAYNAVPTGFPVPEHLEEAA